MNWLICQPWKWRRTLAFSVRDIFSYSAMPLIGSISSGSCSGLSSSSSWDQSIRVSAFHCISTPLR
jgi:hypothetical protein